MQHGYPGMSGLFIHPFADAGVMAGNGTVAGQTCSTNIPATPDGQWVCEHRDPLFAPMLQFRQATAGLAKQSVVVEGDWVIAFSRGTIGWVGINDGLASRPSGPIQTSLIAGTYCDLLTGGKVGGACVGTSVVVDGAGLATVMINARSAIVLLNTDKL